MIATINRLVLSTPYSPTNLIFTTPTEEYNYYPHFGETRKAHRGPRSHSWLLANVGFPPAALNSCSPELTMCLGVRALAGVRSEGHRGRRKTIRADREYGIGGAAGGDGGLAVGKIQKWGSRGPTGNGWAWSCRSGEDDGGRESTCVSAAWQLYFAGSASPSPAGMSSMCWGSVRRDGQRPAQSPKAAQTKDTPPSTLTCWLSICSSSSGKSDPDFLCGSTPSVKLLL